MPNEFIARNGLISLSSVTASAFSGAGTGLTGTASSLSIGGNSATTSRAVSGNSSPAGTAFNNTLIPAASSNRVINFDGNGTSPSVWWTNGSRALGAIDAQDPGLAFWSNNGSSWQQQVSMGYGTFNVLTTLQQGGNQVLHAGNYTSYALPITGGTLTGTRPIDVSTSSGAITIKANAGGWSMGTYYKGSSDTILAGFGAFGDTNTLSYAWVGSAYNSSWMTFSPSAVNSQVALQQSGNQVLHAGNYSSYALPLTGGTLSGNISAANITTGVNANHIVQRDANGYIYANHINFSTSESENPTINSFFVSNGDGWSRKATVAHVKNTIRGVADGTWGISITGGIEATQASLGYSVSGVNIDYGGHGGPQIRSQGGGAAMMSFHRPGAYAINFGLGTDNQLRTGGWSRGGNYLILDAGNYTSYAPSLTGGGASGTWGINVTGNAGTATTATNLSGFDKTNPTFGAVYATNWFRPYGDTGIYTQDYGGHFRRSVSASHGTWEIFGYNKGGYGGLNIIDSAGYWNNHMFEGGNGGVYQENGAGWLWYYNRVYGSFTIGGATVSASYKLYVQGSIYATGVVDWASDVRKKENIVTIDSSLEKVTKLRGVYFNRIDDPKKKTQTGVIAQEVKEIMPELVNYDDMNDSYSVTYGNFAGLFIEAIKEQQKLIESQQKQIDELKSIVDNLNK